MVDGCGAGGKKEEGRERKYAAPRALKRGPVCVGRTAPPFAIPALPDPPTPPWSSSSTFPLRPPSSSRGKHFSLRPSLPHLVDMFAYFVLPFRVPRALISHPLRRSSHSSPSLRKLLLSFRVSSLLAICASVLLSRAYTLLTVINPCSVNISTRPQRFRADAARVRARTPRETRVCEVYTVLAPSYHGESESERESAFQFYYPPWYDRSR